MAGLFGPLLGGWTYDFTNSYTVAILVAATLTLIAGLLALLLLRRPDAETSPLISRT